MNNMLNLFDISVVPIALLPGAVLLCLVFYNRLVAIDGRLRSIQKDLMNMLMQGNIQQRQLKATLEKEMQMQLFRSRLVRTALIFALIGILFFLLCGLLVAMRVVFTFISAEFPVIVWMVGAFCVLFCVILGIFELAKATESLNLQTVLIREWQEEEK